MELNLDHVTNAIIAIGALGTAAFALVDATKTLWGGGISSAGFSNVRKVINRFFPDAEPNNPINKKMILDTLFAHWINGTALADQKAIAKSLVKLRLDKENAAHLANITGVDENMLMAVGYKISNGLPLETTESDVYGRFDLVLTALLDEGYQRADQSYRNAAKALAMVAAVALALFGAWVLYNQSPPPSVLLQATMAGLLATPLAPISKDLASGLAAGVKALQAMRK